MYVYAVENCFRSEQTVIASMTDISERKNVITLLQLYRSLPALWDPSCEDYNNRSKKEKQYAILLELYKKTNPNATKKELTKRINSLRTNYRREVKRLGELQKNSSGLKVEPTLYYYDTLNFLATVESPHSASKAVINKVHKSPEQKTQKPTFSTEEQKKKIPACSTDDLVRLVTDRLKRPPNTFQQAASIWSTKLSSMERSQRIMAEKLINDVIFNAELGLLNYDTCLTNVGNSNDMCQLTPQYAINGDDNMYPDTE